MTLQEIWTQATPKWESWMVNAAVWNSYSGSGTGADAIENANDAVARVLLRYCTLRNRSMRLRISNDRSTSSSGWNWMRAAFGVLVVW